MSVLLFRLRSFARVVTVPFVLLGLVAVAFVMVNDAESGPRVPLDTVESVVCVERSPCEPPVAASFRLQRGELLSFDRFGPARSLTLVDSSSNQPVEILPTFTPTELDTSALEPGVYNLSVLTADGSVYALLLEVTP